MGLKHPIRDLLFFWMGERMWKRHEAKKEMRRSVGSQPYRDSKIRNASQHR